MLAVHDMFEMGRGVRVEAIRDDAGEWIRFWGGAYGGAVLLVREADLRAALAKVAAIPGHSPVEA